MTKKIVKRKRHTTEFKAEAVQLARSSPERSIRQLAYELGIADQTLRNWVKQAQIDQGELAKTWAIQHSGSFPGSGRL